MFMEEKGREGVYSTVVAAGIEGLLEVAAHVVGAWGDALDKLVGGAWNGAVHVESPVEVVVGAVAGECAGDGDVVAAAAPGSGGEEPRRETAERVAGREHHGRRHGRKGIHENPNRLDWEKREIGKEEKKSKGKIEVEFVKLETRFFVKWGPRGSYLFQVSVHTSVRDHFVLYTHIHYVVPIAATITYTLFLDPCFFVILPTNNYAQNISTIFIHLVT